MEVVINKEVLKEVIVEKEVVVEKTVEKIVDRPIEIIVEVHHTPAARLAAPK